MKDYRDILSTLKDKVADVAGKAVSDEMRDKVAGAAQAVGERAKYASRMTRLTVDCNAELERVKRTYTEIGRLYYENYRDTADAFLAELWPAGDGRQRPRRRDGGADGRAARRRAGIPSRAGSAHHRRGGGHRPAGH